VNTIPLIVEERKKVPKKQGFTNGNNANGGNQQGNRQEQHRGNGSRSGSAHRQRKQGDKSSKVVNQKA
jgi:hypothetical protein